MSRFTSLWTLAPLRICKEFQGFPRSCKYVQGLLRSTTPGLLTQFNFLVLKLTLLIGGYGALEVISHLCTAHQDLKNKVPCLIDG